MCPTLRAVLDRHCATIEYATMPLTELLRLLRAEMPALGRGELLSELRAAGYSVGLLDGAQHVGGLAARKRWTVKDGHLVQSA